MSQHQASHDDQVARLGTILSVWAHPDDETYLAGGLMAAAAARGQRVVCVSATAGERGTDDPGRWPPRRLGPVRRMEAAAAMATLGVREHQVLGLPDGGLDRCGGFGAAAVAGLIRQVRPDTIVTFGPDGITGHPDHRAVHHWVVQARRQEGSGARLLQAATTASHMRAFAHLYEQLGVFMSDDRPAGVEEHCLALRLCLGGPELDRKLVALRAMATQTAGAISAVGEDTYAAQVAEEAFVEAG